MLDWALFYSWTIYRFYVAIVLSVLNKNCKIMKYQRINRIDTTRILSFKFPKKEKKGFDDFFFLFALCIMRYYRTEVAVENFGYLVVIIVQNKMPLWKFNREFFFEFVQRSHAHVSWVRLMQPARQLLQRIAAWRHLCSHLKKHKTIVESISRTARYTYFFSTIHQLCKQFKGSIWSFNNYLSCHSTLPTLPCL